jgi:hypothetical protein
VQEISSIEAVPEAIKVNLACQQAVTVFHVNPETPVQPRLGSTMHQNGDMVSDPLEDLSPHLSNEEFNKWMIVPSLRISKS